MADIDLASVRSDAALARLPEAERARGAALRNGVRRLSEAARTAPTGGRAEELPPDPFARP